MNLSVQIVAEGTPCFSECIPSCTLHALQEPQSPIAMMIASELFAKDSSSPGSAGLDALGFFNQDMLFTSYFSVRTLAISSNRTSAFLLLSSISPMFAPAILGSLGAPWNSGTIASVVGSTNV